MSEPAMSYVSPDELVAVYALSEAGKDHEAFILCKLLLYQHPTHPNVGLVNHLASCAAYKLVFKAQTQSQQTHWVNEALTHSAAALAHAEAMPPPKAVHARWALRHGANLAEGGYPKAYGRFAGLAADYARAALDQNPNDPDALAWLAHALTPRHSSKPRTLDEQLELLSTQVRLATTAADRWPLTKDEVLH